jgi:antitoxin ParD1/3/4
MKFPVPLIPEVRRFVGKQLAAGKYTSFADLVNTALSQLEADDEAWQRLSTRKLQSLRREIDIGVKEIERGEFSDWDPEEIKRDGRKILAARRKKAG